LDEEVLIWLPVVIVVDSNLNVLRILTFGEINNFIVGSIIFTGLGVSIKSSNSNRSFVSFFVENLNGQFTG